MKLVKVCLVGRAHPKETNLHVNCDWGSQDFGTVDMMWDDGQKKGIYQIHVIQETRCRAGFSAQQTLD
jgi:hypothetical protein